MSTARSTNVIPIFSRGGPVNLAAWRAYIGTPLQRPKMVTRTKYAAAPEATRRDFDAARKRYHRGLADIETRQMQEVHREIDSRVDGNDGCAPTARTGLVINGMPFVGKSTMLLRWGSKFEHSIREQFGVDFDARTEDGALFIPIVYVVLSEDDGPKGLCQKIMRFYGQPYKERWDEGELTARIQEVSVSSATRVLMMDQMQNLKMRNRSARQTAEHIKQLMDVLPVTMIGAGVEMETTGFFTEGYAPGQHDISQVGRRFGTYHLDPFSAATGEGRADWATMLATVHERLVLLAKRDNDLHALSDYLYERTQGVTGDLMDLLRRGANEAVGGSERITKTLLDTIRLSEAADRDKPITEGLPDHVAAELGRAVKRARAVMR